jgi:hypothetical protein
MDKYESDISIRNCRRFVCKYKHLLESTNNYPTKICGYRNLKLFLNALLKA